MEESVTPEVTVIESKRPEYYEDGFLRIGGSYDKLSNGKTYLYCHREYGWRELKICRKCGIIGCESMRLFEGNPIIHRHTKREIAKKKGEK